LISAGLALALPALVMLIFARRSEWVASLRDGASSRGAWAIAALYLIIAAAAWVLVRMTPHVLNVSLSIVARARRKFRPWLRHHHIRLLPPRWRRRRAHESGTGPLRLKDEILKFVRTRTRSN
jgi:hypothetical protein